MKKIKFWYTISKNPNNKNWTVWLNKEGEYSVGSLGLYSSDNRQDCVDYCRKAGIKIEKEKGFSIRKRKH